MSIDNAAEVAELADAAASKAVDRKIMRVRLSPSAPNSRSEFDPEAMLAMRPMGALPIAEGPRNPVQG